MANYWGRTGAPMIQPTKDDLRQWLREAQTELEQERTERERERNRRRSVEYRLEIAAQKLGELVLEGKITVPAQKLGELVIKLGIVEASEREVQRLSHDVDNSRVLEFAGEAASGP
jgi:hypothetical protein